MTTTPQRYINHRLRKALKWGNKKHPNMFILFFLGNKEKAKERREKRNGREQNKNKEREREAREWTPHNTQQS